MWDFYNTNFDAPAVHCNNFCLFSDDQVKKNMEIPNNVKQYRATKTKTECPAMEPSSWTLFTNNVFKIVEFAES
jgi:hypothetical protein